MTAGSIDRATTITHKQVLVVFSGLVLAMLLAALDSTIVSTALPTIVGELGGLEHLSWVVTAYLLAQTVVTPLYGKLGDLYGRKGVMQGGDRALPRRLGALRHEPEHDAAHHLPRDPGTWRRWAAWSRRRRSSATSSRRASAAATRASSARCSASRASPARCSAATSRRTCRGAGSSTSTFRSARSRSWCSRSRFRRAPSVCGTRSTTSGAALLAVALSALVLLADLGGTTYPWTSPIHVRSRALRRSSRRRLSSSSSAGRRSRCCRCGCSRTARSR